MVILVGCLIGCWRLHMVTAQRILSQCEKTGDKRTGISLAAKQPFGPIVPRAPLAASVGMGGKITARGLRAIGYGDAEMDLSAVEQLVEVGQTRGMR
jgi:hypothetical protein